MDKYHKWHDAIVERARAREAQGMKVEGDWHHVVPKSLGGSNDSDNLVKLTYREHFLVHWLLIKLTEGDAQRKMRHALLRMIGGRSGRRGCFTAWQYSLARAEHVTGLVERPLESINRISDAAKKAWEDPDTRERMITALMKGRSVPGYREKMSEVQTRNWARPEVRKKQSENARRRFADPNFKARHRESMNALLWSCPKVRAKISAARKKEWTDPSTRADKLAILKKVRDCPEVKAKISASMKRKWDDPGYKARMSAALKKAGDDPKVKARRGAAIKAGHAKRKARLAAEG